MIIPWQNPSEFNGALNFLTHLERRRGSDLDPVKAIAAVIEARLESMDGDLDRLCRITCPGCTDNCCERATIFFDFKDLLCLYFGPGQPPRRQIRRVNRRCSHLGSRGCTLPRSHRPFVCTWYFCPAQKQDPAFGRLDGMIREIKMLRDDMEDRFCRITSG